MKYISKLVASVVLAGITFPAAAQLTLSLAPSTQTTGLGGEVTYNIDISGLKSSPDYNGPALGAFSITLDFDSSTASAQSVTIGTLLSNAGPGNDFQVSDLSTPGQIYLSDMSFDSAALLEASQPASFVLGSFTLEGTGLGSTAISFDLANTSLSDENGLGLTLSTANGATLTVVPEPGTCALVGLGLVGLVAQSRRRLSRLNKC
jgi:hypothetical protein